MKVSVAVLIMAVAATGRSSAIPTNDEHKDRTLEKELSDETHFDEENEHNPDYDHEAFLGKEESKTFDQLSPEESRERLGKIADKIDKDGDGKVTEEELKDWIKYVQRRYVTADTERQWKDHHIEGDSISWKDYREKTYGHLTDEEMEDGAYNFKDMIRREERRWLKADFDNDGVVTKEEFSNFLHPEDADHMRDVVVDETIEDIDKDGDGSISLDEYIGDMWPDKDGAEEPEWVKNEREQFSTYRDKNNDGKMDRDEVLEWIIPPDYDHAEAEAKHLIYESDVNKDGVLSKEEILDRHEVFVGSQATDYGEALTRHEEL